MEGKIKSKIKLLFVLSVLISLLFISSVCADIVVDNEDLIIEFDYGELEDNDDNLEISQKITLTNNGSVTENVDLSLSGFSSSYDNLEISPENLELAAGASTDVTITVDAPINLDQGTHDNIGTLTIGSTQYEISANVLLMLEVENIYVLVNGNDDKTIDEDKENINDLAPNDEIELQFQLENLFDSNYDNGDIDGDVYVTLDSNDFGDEIDEEESFDVDAGEELSSDDEMISIKFTVPSNAEEGDYNLEIKVESEDENEAVYTTEWEVELEIEREKDDVRVESFTISPEKVDCHRSFQLVTEVVNYGTDSQKHVVLELFNTELMDHFQEIPEFKLERGTDDDNSVIKRYSVQLPLDFPAGTYSVEAIAYYDYTSFANRKLADLIVEDCATVESNGGDNETDSGEDIETDDSEQNETDGGNLITSSEVINTIEDPYTPEDIMFVVLLVGIILIIFMMVTFFIILMK